MRPCLLTALRPRLQSLVHFLEATFRFILEDETFLTVIYLSMLTSKLATPAELVPYSKEKLNLRASSPQNGLVSCSQNDAHPTGRFLAIVLRS